MQHDQKRTLYQRLVTAVAIDPFERGRRLETAAVYLIGTAVLGAVFIAAVALLTDDVALAPMVAMFAAQNPVLYAVGWVWRRRVRRREATPDAA